MQAADPGENSPEEVPKDVIDRAKSAFMRRTPGEVAALVWDSLIDEDAPPGDHQLRFEHPSMRIVVQVAAASGWSSLQGEVRPPTPVRVDIVLEDAEVGIASAVTDGAFTIERVPSGVVRLCLEGPADTPTVCTDWFRV